MAEYLIRFLPKIDKQLSKLDTLVKKRLCERFDFLQDSPYSGDVKRLKGDSLYRMRVGDYRIIYLIDDVNKIVSIIKVGHRRDVYK